MTRIPHRLTTKTKRPEWQQKGMDLASVDQKADFESRLKLYREKKPYRQSPAK